MSRSHRTGVSSLRCLVAVVLLCLVGSSAGYAVEVPALGDEERKQAEFIYFDRCSGCHGALRKGATGPNITDEKMLDKTLAKLEKTIFDGTDAGMPGWGRTGEMTQPSSCRTPCPFPPRWA
jgi:nitrite reductase (NO-forming)/hydroxylamine reductase